MKATTRLLLSKLRHCDSSDSWTLNRATRRASLAKNTRHTVRGGLGSLLTVSASSVIDPLEGEQLLLLLTFDLRETAECFAAFCLNVHWPLVAPWARLTVQKAGGRFRGERRFSFLRGFNVEGFSNIQKRWQLGRRTSQLLLVSTNQSSASGEHLYHSEKCVITVLALLHLLTWAVCADDY